MLTALIIVIAAIVVLRVLVHATSELLQFSADCQRVGATVVNLKLHSATANRRILVWQCKVN